MSMGFVVSCETVWVAIDFAWEMASLVAPHFFVQSNYEQRKLEDSILFRYTCLTAQLNDHWNWRRLCSTMNHPFCSSQEGNPLSDGSSLPGTLEWKNATLQTMHLFIAPLLWLECLRHVVDEELGKVLQTIDIPKWLSQGFNHSSWLWCIQELHKTESHYQLIQNANPTTAARATNTKKNSTKQSQLKPTIETRKLEDKLRKEPDFSGKTDANDNLPGDASAA